MMQIHVNEFIYFFEKNISENMSNQTIKNPIERRIIPL